MRQLHFCVKYEMHYYIGKDFSLALIGTPCLAENVPHDIFRSCFPGSRAATAGI